MPTTSSKPVILTPAGYYLPGYKAGGPITTLANMVERLGEEFSFRIATRDRDLGDTKPYSGIGEDTSGLTFGHGNIQYLPPVQEVVAHCMAYSPPAPTMCFI